MTPPDLSDARPLASEAEGPTASWRPIATGALGDSLRVALDDIADSLAEPRAAWLPDGAPPAEQRKADLSLAGGAAGHAVFHSYVASTRADRGARELAAGHLGRATEGVAQVEMDASLYSGFTGVAWAVEHLGSGAGGAEDPLADVDEALVSYLERGGPAHYDLVSGLVGIAVYALERRPRARADELLHRVLERLAERAEPAAGGLTWRTPPGASTSAFALGPFDLGLAHGVPGAIAVFAATCLHGVEVGRARALLDGAVEWLSHQRLEAGAASTFCNSSGPGSTGAPSRLAWCYGDLGIACALHLAGRAADEPTWCDEAIALARRAGARDPESGRVCDSGFCHGAAGVAHLLNRLYQASGDERLAGLARAWLARALGWRAPGTGIGGYRTWMPSEGRTGAWADDPGLLSGTAGIGLAFAAAVTPVEPEWDRVFLLSTRRRDA